MAESWIEIGRVKSANPARRELRVRATPGRAHQFETMAWAHLRLADDSVSRRRVCEVRATADAVILTLAPGVPRDAVAGMKGAAVVIAPEERRSGPDGLWAPDDLLGLRVIDEKGNAIGAVSEVIPTPAHSIIEVEREEGAALLLPAIKQVILEVDLKNRTLVIGDTRPYGVESETPGA